MSMLSHLSMYEDDHLLNILYISHRVGRILLASCTCSWRISLNSCSLGSRVCSRLGRVCRQRHWMLRSPSPSCPRAPLLRPQRQSRWALPRLWQSPAAATQTHRHVPESPASLVRVLPNGLCNLQQVLTPGSVGSSRRHSVTGGHLEGNAALELQVCYNVDEMCTRCTLYPKLCNRPPDLTTRDVLPLGAGAGAEPVLGAAQRQAVAQPSAAAGGRIQLPRCQTLQTLASASLHWPVAGASSSSSVAVSNGPGRQAMSCQTGVSPC